MDIYRLLLKIGLSDKEARVYLALLELGKDTVQNIAQKSGINRATTYVILEKLMEFGLTSQLAEGRKTFFVAENPKELSNIIQRRQKELEERAAELTAAMEDLQTIHNKNAKKSRVRYFEGEDGLLALDRYGRDRLTEEGGEILGFSPIDLLESRFPKRRTQSVAERVQADIKSRLIYTKKKPYSERDNRSAKRQAIHLNDTDFPLDGIVSILPWGVKFYQIKNKVPYGVLIEDRDLAGVMRCLYNLAWDGAQQRSQK